MSWRSTSIILLHAIGALVLAWALKHPRAPEGTDPEYWSRRLRAGVRRLRALKRRERAS